MPRQGDRTRDGSAGQQWQLLPGRSGVQAATMYLRNGASGDCLNGGNIQDGTQVVVSRCSAANSAYGQDWSLPSGLILSGVTGLCLTQPSSVSPCKWGIPEDFQMVGGLLTPYSSGCLSVASTLDDAPIVPAQCAVTAPSASETWLRGPGGQLVNAYSGKCRDDPGNGGSGTTLVQEDCYGQPGEIWAFN